MEAAPLAPCGAPDGGRAVWLTAADGVRLRLAVWPGPRPVLVLPGRTEYIEKYGLVVADLARAGRGALVLDWRGQGLSDRLVADPEKGHVARSSDYQADLDACLAAAAELTPGPLPWLAHSMGGCIALRGLMRGLTPPAVTFSAPMLGLSQPPALQKLMATLGALAGPLGLDTGYTPTTGPRFGLPSMSVESNNLTTDPDQFRRMKAQITDNDALSIGGPTLRWMAQSLAEMGALSRLPSPRIPALFGLGSEESIVDPVAIHDRVSRWPGADLAQYPGARHELLMERPQTRDAFIARALALFDASGA